MHNLEFTPENLKAARKKIGYSQQRLADEADVSRSVIAKFETNKNPAISFDVVIRVSRLFLQHNIQFSSYSTITFTPSDEEASQSQLSSPFARPDNMLISSVHAALRSYEALPEKDKRAGFDILRALQKNINEASSQLYALHEGFTLLPREERLSISEFEQPDQEDEKSGKS